MATAKNPKAAGPATRGLRVITKRDGFRRAGREWAGTTTVPLSDLSDEQVEAIKAETMFVVDEVDI
jgi:hypothetical protein